MISVLMVVAIIMSVMVIIGILKWHRVTIEQIRTEIEQAKLRGDIRTLDYCMAFNDGLNDALTIIDKHIQNPQERSNKE